MGIESLHVSYGNTRVAETGGAEPGAHSASVEPDLARLIERWAGLPGAIKRAIVALAESAGGQP
jgi:hypothetical protein